MPPRSVKESRVYREPGLVTSDEIVQRYVGPLDARAVKAPRLVRSDRRPDEFEAVEDMLYTAAAYAGWLSPDQTGELRGDVQGADILFRVSPYSPP